MILDATLSGATVHGREGFYFGNEGELTMCDFVKTTCAIVQKKDCGHCGAVVLLLEEELGIYHGGAIRELRNERVLPGRTVRAVRRQPLKATEDLPANISRVSRQFADADITSKHRSVQLKTSASS
ncbi:hypothetical protein BD414DRAFT_8173 [Trametes punicea]|nr:hypothetical protein BD414DRAFT_8173 [Trametes punicea]